MREMEGGRNLGPKEEGVTVITSPGRFSCLASTPALYYCGYTWIPVVEASGERFANRSSRE